MSLTNWTLKDDIRDYWSARAATFDQSPGHEIFGDDERAAWHALIRRHLGDGDGRQALDLASGTGVVSRLLEELGFAVTGLDFAEPMLALARAKVAARNGGVRFITGDAEATREPDASYDVITNRHLVWTLPDPHAAFADWFRVLKPGGKVLIVDHDNTRRHLSQRVVFALAQIIKRVAPVTPVPGVDRARHAEIVAQVHFAAGARAEAVADLLKAAGFTDITIDRDHRAIRRAQGRHMPLAQRLERAAQDRYAISARKPA